MSAQPENRSPSVRRNLALTLLLATGAGAWALSRCAARSTRDALAAEERVGVGSGGQKSRGFGERAGSAVPAAREEIDGSSAKGDSAAATIELQFVTSDGSVAGGTEVRLLESATFEDRARFRDLDQIDGWMAQRRKPRAADEQGRLRIRCPGADPTLVVAKKDGLFARASIERGSSGRIVLDPDVSLRVRAVDPEEQPLVGATVDLRRLEDGRRDVVRSAATQEDGVARFHHAQLSLGGSPRASLSAGLGDLFVPIVEQVIDLQGLSDGVVTLTAPESGSVEVHVTDDLGSPLRRPVHVTLTVDTSMGDHSAGVDLQLTRRSSDGSARFAYVGLGQRLMLEARLAGSPVGTAVREPGPTRAGETRTIAVRIGADHPVLQGRVLGSDGLPLADRELELLLAEEPAPPLDDREAAYCTVTTDPEGGFLLEIERSTKPSEPTWLSVTLRPESGAEQWGSVELRPFLPVGIVELGDVRLSAMPLLAAGIVVSGTGRPIEGAKIELFELDPATGSWRAEPLGAKTGPDGLFRVMRPARMATARLGASRRGWTGTPVSFTAGAADLVLELTPEAMIEGTVSADARIPLDRFRVEITAAPGAPTPAHPRVTPRERGLFRFRELVPGEYTMRLFLDGDPEALTEIGSVVARAGEMTHDPRLQPFSPAAALSVHQIVVRPPPGGPRVEGRLWYGRAGTPALDQQVDLRAPDALIVTRSPLVDLEVQARGYPPERRDGVAGRIEVPLRAGFLVRLRGLGSQSLEPPLFLGAKLVPAGGGVESLPLGDDVFDAAGELVLQASKSGRMEIQWFVERRIPDSTIAISFSAETQEIWVRETSGEQVVQVYFPDDLERRAHAALEQGPDRFFGRSSR